MIRFLKILSYKKEASDKEIIFKTLLKVFSLKDFL